MRKAVLVPCLLLIVLTVSNAQKYTLEQAFPNLLLVLPVGLVAPGDGGNTLYAIEQPGVIKAFENTPDVSFYSIFLDLRNKIVTGGEMGLLGLAFDPDFKHNGFFYVDYTVPNPIRTIVSRFRVLPDNPLVADSTSETIILSIDQPGPIHKAGQLAFGSDGYLYISTGDGAGANDPFHNGQNLTTLLGKILRIDVHLANSEQPYAIPPDNPFADSSGVRGEIYAYGLRNPWRFSFDKVTGRLWAGDVGQDMREEIDIIERGRNYGWPLMEGFQCNKLTPECDTTGLTPPVHQYLHDSTGGYAIAGGYVYRGPTLTSLVGKYIYGDFVSGRVWSLELDSNSRPVNTLLCDAGISITSFGVDSGNELYLCTYGGAVYKLVQPAGVERGDAPGAFHLGESRPNPAGTSTTIEYRLDRAAHVLLDLHDATGRMVSRIVDEEEGAGEHAAKLDLTGLPAGLYFYRLAAGQAAAARGLVVVK